MGLAELTSRDAVLSAIKEFDALGREAFLKKYGFGHARDIFIRRGDRQYDSKAIAGVAYGNQFPDRGPLKPNDFSGGDATVGQVLERLGFEVLYDKSADGDSHERPSTAWIFQANPKFFDLKGALRKLSNISWLVNQHREDIKPGDTVYLWEGGPDAGIVGVATVIAGPAMRQESAEESVFNRDATKFAGERERVLLGVERVLKERLSRADLRQHPILNTIKILKAPQGTNFALSADEFRALDALIPRGTTALTMEDLESMVAGFAKAGFQCRQRPKSPRNPVVVEWHAGHGIRRYRLWVFNITHGGGGPAVRAADEFRIQITNGPDTLAAFDTGDTFDLLVGYSRDRDAIVGYDRRWLENWSQRKEETGSGGSPSVQVKQADIQAGHTDGIHRITRAVNFGDADIVTLSPAMLPAYLFNHTAVLRGSMTASQAAAAIAQPSAANVLEYCSSQGFPFEPDLIARYLASLLTKPFVILAGVSGTGKSKLAELVAEFYTRSAVGASASSPPRSEDKFVFTPVKGSPDQTRFALVAVRPDWIDNQSMLGFVNPITEQYESTQALDLILRAKQALDTTDDKAGSPRYFMLLDEMNLARVEHYFSDWLACAESRRLQPDGSISQQPVPLHRSQEPMETTLARPDGSTEKLPVPAALALPTNLIVTGTVNVDETTFGFSPKVLDRAMVLEFDEVDLERLRAGTARVAAGAYRFPDKLPPFRLATAADYADLPVTVHQHLVALNAILEGARLQLGYRAANEIALFMRIYNEILPDDPTELTWSRALDAAVLQKVLPRLSGDRARLEVPLSTLCAYLRDLARPAVDVRQEEFDRAAPAKLSKAYQRAVEMLQSLKRFGFVSFFR